MAKARKSFAYSRGLWKQNRGAGKCVLPLPELGEGAGVRAFSWKVQEKLAGIVKQSANKRGNNSLAGRAEDMGRRPLVAITLAFIMGVVVAAHVSDWML